MWLLSQHIMMHWTASPWESMIVRFLRGARRLNPPRPPLVFSLPSWLAFRGIPLSFWIQLSLNSCLLRQRSSPRSLPSRGSGTSKHFRERRVLYVRAGQLSRCPETCAQGSQHAFSWSGGEPASIAL